MVSCHNYAMVCEGAQSLTNHCQSRYGYYCTSKGYTAFSRNDPICDECECIDLMPKPLCIAWIGSGTMGCLRDEGSTDLSTLFQDPNDYRDETTTNVRGEVSLERQEQQLSDSARSSLKDDKGQNEEKLHKRTSFSNQEPPDINADSNTQNSPDSYKEERQHLTPFNTTDSGPTATDGATEMATATSTSQPGQAINCTDAECCNKKFARAKSQTHLSNAREPETESEAQLDPYIKGFLASKALQHPCRDTDRGGGGGHGGGGHGSGGGRGGGGRGGGGTPAAAAGAGSTSTASTPMTIRSPAWLCFKVLMGTAVSVLVWAL